MNAVITATTMVTYNDGRGFEPKGYTLFIKDSAGWVRFGRYKTQAELKADKKRYAIK